MRQLGPQHPTAADQAKTMTKADRDARLWELLLHESAEVRDDERYMFAQYAAILTVAVLVIGAMATVFYVTCPKGYDNCQSNDKITPISIWIYVGAPLLPVALIAYTVFISAILTLRSYYLRTIERRIHKLTGQRDDQLPIPSWAHLQLEVAGQTQSRRSARLNLCLIYVIVFLMVMGCVFLAFSRIPVLRYRIFALALDGTVLSILISATILNLTKGPLLWEGALEGLPGRLGRTDDGFPLRRAPPGERSLESFLLLPRNQEELLKALFIPICFGIGRCLAPGIPELKWDMVWYPLGFFLVFEFVIYQARYLLNDVRDREVDCREGLSKRRFPCSLTENPFALKAALASFLLRLVIAVLLVGCIFPYENSKWIWHVCFLVSVFLIALPYETFRSRCNAAVKAGSWTRFWTVAVISVVGLGYGLRSVVGLWLAGVSDKIALSLVFVGASLFGSTFVGLTWALESTRADEKVLADGKGHLVLFHRAVSRTAHRAKIAVSSTERVLEGWQSPLALWNIPAVLATTGLAAFVLYLVRGHLGGLVSSVCLGGVRISVIWLVLIAVAGIAAVAVITPVGTSLVFVALTLVGEGIVLHRLSVPVTQSVLAAAITALPLIVSCTFRNMRFKDLPGFTDKLIGLGAGGVKSFYFWFKRAR